MNIWRSILREERHEEIPCESITFGVWTHVCSIYISYIIQSSICQLCQKPWVFPVKYGPDSVMWMHHNHTMAGSRIVYHHWQQGICSKEVVSCGGSVLITAEQQQPWSRSHSSFALHLVANTLHWKDKDYYSISLVIVFKSQFDEHWLSSSIESSTFIVRFGAETEHWTFVRSTSP